MIVIKGTFFQINIDPNKEYAIYGESYLVTMSGKQRLPEYAEEVRRGHCYEYGNVFIETERKKYTLSDIYTPYDLCARIIEAINSQNGSDNILIDLSDETNEIWDLKGIKVETL